MKIKSIVQNGALVAVSLVVAAVCGELLLRAFKPQIMFRDFPSGLYLPDKDTCHLHRPLLNAYYETQEFKVDFVTNSLGMRDREAGQKRPDRYRILVIGDSFTWGVGVPQDKAFPKVLERLLDRPDRRVEVINAGVSSYDTRQEYYYLQKYGLALEPDMVVLAFVPNDVTGYDGCITVVNADGDLTTRDHQDIRVPRKRGLRIPNPFSTGLFMRMNSHLYLFIDTVVQRVLFGGRREVLVLTQAYEKSESMSPSARTGYALVYAYLNRIRDLCVRNNVRLVLAAVPVQEQMHPDDYLGPRHTMRQPQLVVGIWAYKNGIPFVDPLDGFRAAQAKRALYWPIDGHMNEHGYRLFAESLSRALEDLGPLRTTR